MNDITSWWNGLGPGIRAALRDGLVIVVGLVVGRVLGGAARRLLVKSGVDRFLRTPWTHAETMDHSRTGQAEVSALTTVTEWFITLTVWAGTACVIAWLHGSDSALATIRPAIIRAWQVAAVVFLAVVAGGWLAHTTYTLFQTPWLKRELDALFADVAAKDGSFSDTAARFVCIVIYAAFLLLVPVAVAGLFNFNALAGLVGPAWQMCARLLSVPVAFAIGYLGLALVRSLGRQSRKEGADHSEIEYYVGLGIAVGTTLLALGLLLGVSSGAGAVAMIALAVLFLFLLWPIRKHLRDIWAGLLLRLQDVKAFTVDGAPAEIQGVGLLMTNVLRDGQELKQRNSEVLKVALKIPPKEKQAEPPV